MSLTKGEILALLEDVKSDWKPLARRLRTIERDGNLDVTILAQALARLERFEDDMRIAMSEVENSKIEEMVVQIQVTRSYVEAVGALLYNLIYDQEPGNGWTPDDAALDPTYQEVFLAFARSLLTALRDYPEESDVLLVIRARQGVDRTKVSFDWETLAVDDTFISLPSEAQKYLSSIRAFLTNPLLAPEGKFLLHELRGTNEVE